MITAIRFRPACTLADHVSIVGICRCSFAAHFSITGIGGSFPCLRHGVSDLAYSRWSLALVLLWVHGLSGIAPDRAQLHDVGEREVPLPLPHRCVSRRRHRPRQSPALHPARRGRSGTQRKCQCPGPQCAHRLWAFSAGARRRFSDWTNEFVRVSCDGPPGRSRPGQRLGTDPDGQGQDHDFPQHRIGP